MTAPEAADALPEQVAASDAKQHKKRFRRRGRNDGYQFNAENDIVGIVMLEVEGAKDLPRLRNSALIIFLPYGKDQTDV
jgi:phosphatidylserine decarboxylase